VNTSWTLLTDPVWPWSLPYFGWQALVVVAVVLVGLTVWTYRGVRGATPQRVTTILLLRLLALLAALVAVVRPSVGYSEDLRVPSVLLLGMDYSESMTIRDEVDGQSRWEYLKATLKKCEPVLQRLREQNNVNVLLYRFAGDVAEYDPNGVADGKVTDIGLLMQTLYEKHRGERFLRGLVILSDGAHNGEPGRPLAMAPQLRALPCPVSTVGFGKPTTSDRQNDVALKDLTTEPSPVPVKGELTLKGIADAPGFVNQEITIRVLIDDKEVPIEKLFINGEEIGPDRKRVLPLTEGNEIKAKVTAPNQPGEVKVTMRLDPLLGELSKSNNEITTFVTVTKEGISVLLVDKERLPEPQFICDALRNDQRIRTYGLWFRGDEILNPNQKDLFEFDKQHYDVIILGDLTADRLRRGNPNATAIIKKLVSEKGTGLMMMGGYHSFGTSWKGTEIEQLLPVPLDNLTEDQRQVGRPVKMVPTRDGLDHYVMRLSDKADGDKELWNRLPGLNGYTRLGVPKEGNARILAKEGNGPDVLLVAQDYGNGRTMAFAGDTTWMWKRDEEGVQAHARFWKQVVLWLAKQEQAEGNVWVKPEVRRLAAGNKLGFTTGVRGKGGIDLKDAEFQAKVVGPNQAETPVLTKRDKMEDRGDFYKTEAPGEYRVVVHGKAKDADGQPVEGEASARFVVYQDDAEMLRRAADHQLLKTLAASGGGEFLRPDELPAFLEKVQTMSVPTAKPKGQQWPNWQRTPHARSLTEPGGLRDHAAALVGTGILPVVLVFVGLLSAEWLLRRRWGLV
jgi:uncharacterized membrane protein